MDRPRTRTVQLTKKIVFSFLPLLFFVVSAEISLRAAGLPKEKYLLDKFAFPPKDLMGKAFAWDPDRFWRLIPDYNGPWTMRKLAYTWETDDTARHVDLEHRELLYPDKAYYDCVTWDMDAQGFRGPPPVPDKRRILFLGSSVTFGWGVRAEDSFPAILREKLRDEGFGDWDAINAGVPGYSSHQSLRYLNELQARYHPEIVVFESGVNDGVWAPCRSDAELALASGAPGTLPSLLGKSNVVLWLHYFIHDEKAYATQRVGSTADSFFATRMYVPGKARVSPEEYVRNLGQLKTLGELRRMRVYLLFPPLFNERGDGRVVKSVTIEDPFEIDALSSLERMPAADLERCFLPYDEVHFSRTGHRLVAGKIWERLARDSILARR